VEQMTISSILKALAALVVALTATSIIIGGPTFENDKIIDTEIRTKKDYTDRVDVVNNTTSSEEFIEIFKEVFGYQMVWTNWIDEQGNPQHEQKPLWQKKYDDVRVSSTLLKEQVNEKLRYYLCESMPRDKVCNE